jgi:hypothetical protein
MAAQIIAHTSTPRPRDQGWYSSLLSGSGWTIRAIFEFGSDMFRQMPFCVVSRSTQTS